MYFKDEVLPILPQLRQLYASAGCQLVVFTILRRPVQREVSFYRFFRGNKGISLQEWLRHDCNTTACFGYDRWRRSHEAGEGFWGRDNVQTRALLGWPEDRSPTTWCNNRTLAEGQAVLEQLDVVGTQSNFDASLLLLWESFGLRPATAAMLGVRPMHRQSYSRRHSKWRESNLATNLVQQLQKVTRCDESLFAAFASRLQQRIGARGSSFGLRLRALLSQRAEQWDHEHIVQWAPGSRCSQSGMYTVSRYDPVCNRSLVQCVTRASGPSADVCGRPWSTEA